MLLPEDVDFFLFKVLDWEPGSNPSSLSTWTGTGGADTAEDSLWELPPLFVDTCPSDFLALLSWGVEFPLKEFIQNNVI